MNIPDIILKIKGFLDKSYPYCFLVLSLILIGLSGYFLGKSTHRTAPVDDPITVIYPDPVKPAKIAYLDVGKSTTPKKTTAPAATSNDWLYAGSKNGKTYYTKDCAGINRIKPENRVYFTTQAAAVAAGYSLSKTCHESN